MKNTTIPDMGKWILLGQRLLDNRNMSGSEGRHPRTAVVKRRGEFMAIWVGNITPSDTEIWRGSIDDGLRACEWNALARALCEASEK